MPIVIKGPPAAVLLVKGEVKELVLHLPVNGGLECPTNWCLVILAPPSTCDLLTNKSLKSFRLIEHL